MYLSKFRTVLLYGLRKMSFLEQIIKSKIEKLTIGLRFELYTKIHRRTTNKKIFFNTFLMKWFPIQIQRNPFNVIVSDCLFKRTYDNSIEEKIIFENGRRMVYISDNFQPSETSDKSKKSEDKYTFVSPGSHLLFIGNRNYSHLLTRMKSNFEMCARDLCMITRNPLDENVFVINDSFDEMIFKDTEIISK